MGAPTDRIDFDGKVALVTGGSRGIGAATVRLLARLGARVAFSYRADRASADAVTGASGGRARGWPVDVRNDAAMAELVAATVDAFGGLDVAVASAGIWTGGRIDAMTPEAWRETLDVNLTGTWHLCRHAIPALRSGAGCLVVISSTAGQRGEAGHSHYAATKGAQIALVKSLAVECAPAIRVNAVAPGWVDTDMSAASLQGPDRTAIEAQIPLGRVAAAEDVACAVAYLASDWARHVTGEVLNVNGGAVLCG